MKQFNTKKFVFCLALASAASSTCFADTIAVDTSSKQRVVSCPTEFQQVKISDDARQCQAFEKNITSVMVYHSPSSPSEMLSVYQAAHPSLQTHSPIKGRTLLSSEDKTVRVVISPDNSGSQVDILVTSKAE